MNKYLTYADYTALGGDVDESTFNLLSDIVESKLNYCTHGKLMDFDTVPDVVKKLIVRLVSVYNSCDYNRDTSIASYSNGIETISYVNNSTSSAKNVNMLDERVFGLIKEYLWEYPELFYRGRKSW